MENKYHIGQIVETFVDLEENGIKIDKGSICEIVKLDEDIGYVLVKDNNDIFSWVYETNIKPKIYRIFMGGTTRGFNWREVLENRFKDVENVELFNPIVADWNCERIIFENRYKEICELNLFVVTPYMEGVYSIAEAVDLSNKKPENLVFAYIDHFVDGKEIRDFTKKMKHSLNVTGKMIVNNGGKVFTSLDDVENYIREFIK
jgi:hypothetical protein